MRIMVTENHILARQALTELLTDQGWQVREASSAHEALSGVADFLPHVVLCEYRLPDLPDLELVRQLKARLPRCPVVVMTGVANEFDDACTTPEQEALAAGAAAFVVKPIDFAALLHELDTLVGRRRSGLRPGPASVPVVKPKTKAE